MTKKIIYTSHIQYDTVLMNDKLTIIFLII